MSENKRFKPSFVRDREVILWDMHYAQKLLEHNPNDEWLKQAIKECEDELSYTKPSFIERIIQRCRK